jgi:hypothetical protein
MDRWLIAESDNMIADFWDQLRTATEEGWDRSKPDHYRAILAALELALRHRRALLAANVPGARPLAEARLAEAGDARPRWTLLPVPCPVPSQGR